MINMDHIAVDYKKKNVLSTQYAIFVGFKLWKLQ